MKPLRRFIVTPTYQTSLPKILSSHVSSNSKPKQSPDIPSSAAEGSSQDPPPLVSEEARNKPHVVRKKSMAELDEEMRLKMEGISGEGGASGVEYENGKAEGLKRGVKSNMFRVI